MTTIHANTPRDALSRLEHMLGMTGIDLPMRSTRAQIASALHVVLQLQRMSGAPPPGVGAGDHGGRGRRGGRW